MPTEEVTKLIEAAIRDHEILRATYRGLDGTEGTFEVEPYAIRFNRAKHRVLWVFRVEEDHPEELLWDGNLGAAPTGRAFVPRPWINQ